MRNGNYPAFDESDDAPRSTRGVFLVQGIGFLASGPLIKLAKEVLITNKAGPFELLDRQAEQLEASTFKPGDTIPGPLPVQIGQEWTLTYKPADAAPFFRTFDGQRVGLNVRANNTVPRNVLALLLQEQNQLTLSAKDLEDTPEATTPMVWRVRPVTLEEEQSKGKTFDRVTYDVTTQAPDGVKTKKQLSASYRLNWYRAAKKMTGSVNPDTDTCVSERPMEQATYQHIDGLVRLMRRAVIGKEPVVMITRPRKLDSSVDSYEAMYKPKAGVAIINADHIEAPVAEDKQAELRESVVVHELSHAIYDQAEEATGSSLQVQELKVAFTKLAKIAQELDPKFGAAANSCDPRYLPVFQLFDEDKYLPSLECSVGHPSSNAGEIFASGLNIMRLKPELFADRFATLSLQQQAMAREIKTSILDIVRSTLAVNNESTTVLTKIVPQVTELHKL